MQSSRTGSGSAVKIRELADGDSLRPFIDVAWTVNRRDPYWVPPLRMAVRTVLDRKHPFHAHAAVTHFLAERGRRIVGRISAILNHRHHEFHGDRLGFFGLFECENDPAAATALFDRAAEWLQARGCDAMRGPVNLSTNDEISSPGVLIEGFTTRPVVLMSHNPPYYAALHEGAGFEKAKDLIAFFMDEPDRPPERGVAALDKILEREGVRVRTLDLRHFRRDVDLIKQVYNAAWSRNWGFVPMTDAEFDHLARDFRPIVDPDLCLIAETGAEPVGFSLALPDLNEVLRRIPDGRLFPTGLLKLLWYRSRIRTLRVLTLGFATRLHRAGLGPALYHRTFTTAVAKGYREGECSWILEDNQAMIRPLERMGARPYRRYRLFEKTL